MRDEGDRDDRRQLRGYVTDAERDEFKAYARSMGLDQSSVFVLLLLRAGRFGPSDWERVIDAADRVVTGKAKVTAHVKDPDVYRKVALANENCPDALGQGRMRSALVRLELEERWLWRSVGFNDSD